MAPSSPNTVYAMLGAPDGIEYVGFFDSTDSGRTWARRTVPAASFDGGTVTIDGTSENNDSQSFYDQALAVSPCDPHTIYFGGIGLYRSTDSGRSWTFLAPKGGTHANMHAIGPDPFSNLIYVGNDGGLYSYDPAAGNFNALNSTLAVGRIQSIGPHPTNSHRMLAVFQDNGTLLYSGTLDWKTVDTPDGGSVLFDHRDPKLAYRAYTSSNSAQIARSTDGGMTWDFVDPTGALHDAVVNADDSRAALYPPLASDPAVAHRVFFGGHTIFVSTDGMLSWQSTDHAGFDCCRMQHRHLS